MKRKRDKIILKKFFRWIDRIIIRADEFRHFDNHFNKGRVDEDFEPDYDNWSGHVQEMWFAVQYAIRMRGP